MEQTDRANTTGRLIGFGQPPCDELCATVFSMGFSQVPILEYVSWTVELPLTDAQIQATFGNEIDLLQSPKAVPGVTSVDSSFIQNGTLQVDMLLVGLGIHIFGEPVSFSTIGNAIAITPAPALPVQVCPVGTSPVSPDVFTVKDLALGALGPVTGISPAEWEWGVADWEAAWHLMYGYQFQWILANRCLLINELVADIAYCAPFANAEASGDSEIPIQRYVRQVNDRYRAQGGCSVFAPINARRVGSVNQVNPCGATGATGATGAGPCAGIGVFHPTRDFDLSPYTMGGLAGYSGSSASMPYRKLNKAMHLERGLPINMVMRAQDAYHQIQMQKFMSISENAGGCQANIQYDSVFNGVTNTGPNTFLELTLDPVCGLCTNSFANQQVQTDRVLFKGGVMKLSILLKGFELWGAWRDYLRQSSYCQTFNSISSPAGLLPR